MEKCLLCNSCENDELKFGELLRLKDFAVHHFCLLFAPALAQKGDDDQGLQGFLEEDILKEHSRVKQLRCVYCENPSANLGCCVKSCTKTYHISCANMNNVEFQFVNQFPTFCSRHAQHRQRKKPNVNDICSICQEEGKWSSNQLGSILLPCCKKWLHRVCLQKWARKAGSLFKCPLCNDQDKCSQMLPKLGIFLPEKDADWELFDDTFQDFHEPPERFCESTPCFVSRHMSYSEDPSQWKVCFTCGGGSMHLECFETRNEEEFNCQACQIPENFSEEAPQRYSKTQSGTGVVEYPENSNKSMKKLPFDEEIASSSDEDDNALQRIQQKGVVKANKRRILSDDEDANDICPTKAAKVPVLCELFDGEGNDSTSEDDEDNIPLILMRTLPARSSSSESSQSSTSNEKSRKRYTFLFSEEEAATSSDDDDFLIPVKASTLPKPCKRRMISENDDSSDDCQFSRAKTGKKSNQRRIVSDDDDEEQTSTKILQSNIKIKACSVVLSYCD